MLYKVIALRENGSISRTKQIDITNTDFKSDCEKIFSEYDELLATINIKENGFNSAQYQNASFLQSLKISVTILKNTVRPTLETDQKREQDLKAKLLTKLTENTDDFVKIALTRKNVRKWLSDLLTFDFGNTRQIYIRPNGFDFETSQTLLVSILKAEETMKPWERLTPNTPSFPFLACMNKLDLIKYPLLAEKFNNFTNLTIKTFLDSGKDESSFQSIVKLLRLYPEGVSAQIINVLNSRYADNTKLKDASELEKLSVLRIALLLRNPGSNNYSIKAGDRNNIPLGKSPLHLVKSNMLEFLQALNGQLPSYDSLSLSKNDIYLNEFRLSFVNNGGTDKWGRQPDVHWNPSKINSVLISDLIESLSI